MDTQTVVLWVVFAVLVIVYMARRNSRIKREE